MSYDSAIKVINEKRKLFTSILKQWKADEGKQLNSIKLKIRAKIDKLYSISKELKELSNGELKYEELHKAMMGKNGELKQVINESIKPLKDVMFAFFKDSVKLSDLGSIEYLRSTEPKLAHGSPLKEIAENNNERVSAINIRKIQRKGELEDIVTEGELIKQSTEMRQGNKVSEENVDPNTLMYPETSRGKNSYFGITEYNQARYKVPAAKHKKTKISMKTSHTLNKASDLVSSGYLTTSRYTASRKVLNLIRKEEDKENIDKGKCIRKGDKTVEDIRNTNNISATGNRINNHKEIIQRPINSSCRRAYMSKYSTDNPKQIILQQKQAKENLARIQIKDKMSRGAKVAKRKYINRKRTTSL